MKSFAEVKKMSWPQIERMIKGVHLKNIRPAVKNLSTDPHQAIPTIYSNIRQASAIVPTSLQAIERVISYVGLNPKVLENPKTFNAFGLLLTSSVYHLHQDIRRFKSQRLTIEDVTLIRLRPFLKKYYNYNPQIYELDIVLNDYNAETRIPSLTDHPDLERNYDDFRGDFEGGGKEELVEIGVSFLRDNAPAIADLARFRATLSYPHNEVWYQGEKLKISTMIRALYEYPQQGDEMVQMSFDFTEIGSYYPDQVYAAQQKLLATPNFRSLVSGLSNDITVAKRWAWRFAEPGSVPDINCFSR